VQQPFWLCHVEVDDVQSAVDSALSLDGEVLIPPADRPELGRSALIADPLRGMLSVLQPASGGLLRW
jgi:predicted enzyme related to lactoylglutathione lyase